MSFPLQTQQAERSHIEQCMWVSVLPLMFTSLNTKREFFPCRHTQLILNDNSKFKEAEAIDRCV